MTIPQDRLRNFSIIAHIDHGKSTLADRLLEMTHTIDARQMTSQVLDSMDLEREKGITIKARAVRLEYVAGDGLTYGLNLIDTPGHVDFAYEVSHSLQACEGAILVVDATQGIEAQTLANVHLALRENLTLIPVLNKIDLPSADPETIMDELENVLAIPREEVILASAKDGTGVAEILEAIVARIPAPKGDPSKPVKGLIFDSHYDAYKGVVVYIRLAAGTLKSGEPIRLMASGAVADPLELGVFRPQLVPVGQLVAGEVGYVATGLKSVRDAQVGDTVTTVARPAEEPLPGYQEAKSLVFAGIYPVSGEDYPLLRDALEKLHLNDASFTYTPESSVALGFGFRCGFLGLLHMEIVQERLEREFSLDLIASAPSVEYHVQQTLGRGTVVVDNPALLPNPTDIEVIEEPWVKLSLVTPTQYIGALMELSTNRRGDFTTMEYLDPTRVVMHFEMPLAELIIDYFDQMKSRSQGYASMDYEELGYRPANLVKVDILVNGEPVDALSLIVHRDRAQSTGRALTERLKQLIPRQMFEIPIQAAIGSNVIARESVRAMRKNVLAKCYGGDITRKKKLLEKQKEGKQRMKRVGSVEIPQEAFLAMLRMDEGYASVDEFVDLARWLITVGLTLLLIMLRLDAEKFGTAEYYEATRYGERPRVRRRLAWYGLGFAIAIGILVIHPSPQSDLFLGSGDRLGAVLGGIVYGLLGIAVAVTFATYRYHRIRFPDAWSYPGALLNSTATAFIDEAAFRGALFGLLLVAGVNPTLANFTQAIIYTLTTRLGAPGRDRYLLLLTMGMGLIGGWLTVATGGIAAAFLGHAITRFAVFLCTGHTGQTKPRGREIEEIEKRRRPPEGWRIIGSRESASRDR